MTNYEQFSSILLDKINNSIFESGKLNEADEYFQEVFDRKPLQVSIWLDQLFIENYHKSSIITALLSLMSHIELVNLPGWCSLALASIAHKDPEVVDMGLQCLDNWGTQQSIIILQNIKVSIPWLNDYRLGIISEFTKESNNEPQIS